MVGLLLGTSSTLNVLAQDASGAQDTAPFLSPIPDQTADEDAATIPVRVLYGDAQTPFHELRLTAVSSNPQLLPSQNIVFNDAAPREMVLVPADNQSGVATVTLTVENAQGRKTSQNFRLTVKPVNDPPRISANGSPTLTLLEDDAPQTFSLRVADLESQALTVTAISSDPALIPNENLRIEGSGEDRTLSLRPAPDQHGSTTILLLVADPEGAQNRLELAVRVQPVNDPPKISFISDQHIRVNQVLEPTAFAVSDDETPPWELIVEGSSSNPLLVPDGNILFGGSGEPRIISLRPAKDATGTALITVRVRDSERLEFTKAFLLTVDPEAAPPPITVPPPAPRPVAHAVSIAAIEDTSVEMNLTGESPAGSALNFIVVSTPQKGTLTGTPPNLVYTPKPNVSGADSFQFKVNDGARDSWPATVSIAIQEVNDPPTISSIASRQIEPGQSTGPIRFTVEDVETGKLVVTARSSDPALVPDQNIQLTGQDTLREVTLIPASGKTGAAVITLSVTDEGGLSASTAFEVKVAGTSPALKADAQSVVTLEDVPVAIALRGQSSGASPDFVIVDPPSKGTLSGFPPNLVYRPRPNESGQDRFTFSVHSATAESPPAAVEVLILAVNDPPMARSQSVTVHEDTPLEITLGASDADQDTLTFQIVSDPIKGKLSGSPPRLIYTPNPNETGSDQFTFVTSDAELTSAPATIRIAIEPVNDPPTTSGFYVSTLEDTAVAVSLKARDVDGDALTYAIPTPPAKGVLAGTPPDLLYLPNPNANGLDRFTFSVSDGKLSSEPAVVTVLITPVNDPPAAQSQFLSLAEDTTVDVLLSGRDADGDPLSFLLASPPSKGTLLGTTPRLTYKPDPNFNGLDSFSFKVSDGTVESAPATVTLSVRSINDPPVAFDQYVVLDEDSSHGIALTGYDVEGAQLRFQVADPPKHASLAGVPPNLIYTPARDFNGTDRFTFKISDGDLDSAAATVEILVRPVNDAPVAHNQFLTVAQGRSRVVTLSGSDAESSPLQFILTSEPSKGVLSGTPPNLVYLPNPNERGLDSFSFKVSDGLVESPPAIVQISLAEKINGPTISSMADQTSRNGEPIKIPFTVSDTETAPNKLVIAASSSNLEMVPAGNIVVEGLGNNRTVTVTPAKAQPGTATITLVVWDEDGLAASAQFAVRVVLENQPPTAETLSLTTPEDQPLAIELKASDPEKAPLTFAIASPPTKGRLSGSPPNLIYTPNRDATGPDQFKFTAADSTSISAGATVSIQILAVNDPPTISKISDQRLELGQTIGPIQFAIDDPDTALSTLTLEANFSSPSLIQSGSVFFNGSGNSRTFTAIPAAGKSGVTTVTLKVRDGELSASTTFQLTVVAPNQLPTIELVHPLDLSVADPSEPLALEAKAADADGGIARVDFFAGATLIGSATTAPYQFSWNSPAKGQIRLTAKAIDNRAAEMVSSPINVRVDQPAGRVAILSGGDDPDLALIRRYLFELPVQWRILPRAETDAESLAGEADAVLWHQPATAALQSRDLNLAQSLADSGRPLYFLGDSLIAASRQLPVAERDRWQRLIHLKPGGSSWINQVAILQESDHPVVKNGPLGSVERFAYPIASQQSAVQTGLPGETVLGRSGTFDVLVAAAPESSSARIFTHHLRLSGASDAAGAFEQAKLFKNAIGWLLEKPSFADNEVYGNIQFVDPKWAAGQLRIRREDSGLIRVELSGTAAGANYLLETSDDLLHWSPLNAGFSGPAASASFSSAAAPHRFFRAVPSSQPMASVPESHP